tara:strand:- start:299 stop:667 length:369 start_codon:yes stop_codon:yes gene_type:complete
MLLKKFIEKLFGKAKKLDDSLSKDLSEIESKLLKRARLNATIDPRRRTGNLYESISVGKIKVDNKTRIILQAGNQKVNYAGYVEFGTSRMYPRLYLTKAQRETEREMSKKLQQFASLYMRIK